MEELADPNPGPAHWAARVVVAQLISQCSPLDRSLLLHRFWGGYSTFEIARLHGLSRIATRVRLHRSWKALRQSMDRGSALQRNRGARDDSPVQVGPGGRRSDSGKAEPRRSARQPGAVPVKPDSRAA
ncbi:MAG: RNA polymerase sigma factor [Bryobacteraceae bacterium]